MFGAVIRKGNGTPKEEPEDLDERTRFQYLAVLQFLQAKGFLEAYAALEAECGLSYLEDSLSEASMLEASLDMFKDYRSAAARGAGSGRPGVNAEAAAAAAAAEEELLRLERGACCTGEAGEISAPAEPFTANVTAVCWVASRYDEYLALAATADKRLRLIGAEGTVLAEFSDLPSPVLGLDACCPTSPGASTSAEASSPSFEVLATAMGGEVSLLRLRGPSEGGSRGDEGSWRIELAQRFRDHSKHCSVGRFSPPSSAAASGADEMQSECRGAGEFFLTISRDHTARLYARRRPRGASEEEDAEPFAAAGVVRLASEVTACCWAGPETFVLAARDEHHLLYWDVTGGPEGGPKEHMKANMNALGDSVVSFAVLSLALSPNGKMIAASTDRSRVIVFQAFGTRQLRNLYGATVEEYDTPTVCFSLDGSFVYATSSLPLTGRNLAVEEDERLAKAIPQLCGQIAIFELRTGELVLQLPCHERPVRCMQRHPFSEALVSGSFDKTVRFWS